METGTVKWFNATKGFGFIARNGEDDIFVHSKAIVGSGFRVLKQGDQVKFETEQGRKGLQAKNVSVV